MGSCFLPYRASLASVSCSLSATKPYSMKSWGTFSATRLTTTNVIPFPVKAIALKVKSFRMRKNKVSKSSDPNLEKIK